MVDLFSEKNIPFHPFGALVYFIPSGKINGYWKNYKPVRPPGMVRFESKHSRTCQKIGNCSINNLLGGISLHSSIQAGKIEDPTPFKQFHVIFNEMVWKKYGFLLDLDPLTRRNSQKPSTVAYDKIDKAKKKWVK